MFAFVNEVIDTIRMDALKDRLHLLVEKRFRGELNKCQGCAICKWLIKNEEWRISIRMVFFILHSSFFIIMYDINKIREDFPILSREVYGKPLIYLDNGATTQKPRCVVEAITT